MMKLVEFNENTKHVNNIFHDPVPTGYEPLNGYEISEKECEQMGDGGWYVSGYKQKNEIEILLEENERLKISIADLWEIVLLGGND